MWVFGIEIGAFVAHSATVALGVGHILVIRLLGRFHVVGERVSNTILQRFLNVTTNFLADLS